MRSHWTIAALLSSALIVGCNGRSNENSLNTEQNPTAAPANAPAAADQAVAPAPPAQSQQPYSTADNSAVTGQRTAAAPRATTGRRETVTPRTTTSRNETSAYSAPPEVGLPAREDNRVAATPAPVPRPQWREVTLPAGTALPLQMTSAISSESAQVETPVSARLSDAVVINGDTVIPAGSVLTGTVTDVERSGRVKGRAHVAFAFNEVRINNGREDIRTDPVNFEAEATKGEDATKVGAGAVGGAILGGILGGKKGAAKGAVAGGAVGGGVVAATRGKEVVVAEGTNVTATLAAPVTLRIPIR
jgi:hypothetical protein